MATTQLKVRRRSISACALDKQERRIGVKSNPSGMEEKSHSKYGIFSFYLLKPLPRKPFLKASPLIYKKLYIALAFWLLFISNIHCIWIFADSSKSHNFPSKSEDAGNGNNIVACGIPDTRGAFVILFLPLFKFVITEVAPSLFLSIFASIMLLNIIRLKIQLGRYKRINEPIPNKHKYKPCQRRGLTTAFQLDIKIADLTETSDTILDIKQQRTEIFQIMPLSLLIGIVRFSWCLSIILAKFFGLQSDAERLAYKEIPVLQAIFNSNQNSDKYYVIYIILICKLVVLLTHSSTLLILALASESIRNRMKMMMLKIWACCTTKNRDK